MLVITDRDIDNKKDAIKAIERYYTRQMTIKNLPKREIDVLQSSCQSLIDSLENVKKTISYMFLLDPEKHGAIMNSTKEKIMNVYASCEDIRNNIVVSVRETISAAA